MAVREECWPLAVTFHPPGPPPLQPWEQQVAAADAEQTGTGSSGFDAVLLPPPLPANVRSSVLDGSEESSQEKLLVHLTSCHFIQ